MYQLNHDIQSMYNLLGFQCDTWKHMGKNTIKGNTKVNGHFLKLHFCMFEKSFEWNIIIWIIIFFLEYFSSIAKFKCSKFDTNKKWFCMFKTVKLQEWTILIFFKHYFFFPNVHHFFWKLKRILTAIIKRTKGFELMKFNDFTIHLSTFASKVFFTLKILDFENVHLTKIIYIYVIEGMNA